MQPGSSRRCASCPVPGARSWWATPGPGVHAAEVQPRGRGGPYGRRLRPGGPDVLPAPFLATGVLHSLEETEAEVRGGPGAAPARRRTPAPGRAAQAERPAPAARRARLASPSCSRPPRARARPGPSAPGTCRAERRWRAPRAQEPLRRRGARQRHRPVMTTPSTTADHQASDPDLEPPELVLWDASPDPRVPDPGATLPPTPGPPFSARNLGSPGPRTRPWSAAPASGSPSWTATTSSRPTRLESWKRARRPRGRVLLQTGRRRRRRPGAAPLGLRRPGPAAARRSW
jgi:hypothetical protein